MFCTAASRFADPSIIIKVMHKKKYTRYYGLCWIAIIWSQLAVAQQIPLAYFQYANPRAFNPAAAGSWERHQLFLGHQQRGDGDNGYGRISDFFNYSSARSREATRLGYSFRFTADQEHTQTRVNICPGIAARLIDLPHISLGMGVNAGLLLFQNKYSKVRIFDPGDAVLSSGGTQALDAGAGLDMAWQWPRLRGDFGIYVSQLGGNIISNDRNTPRVTPHCTAYFGTLLEAAPNLFVGPRLLYHNALLADTSRGFIGQMDIGFKAELMRQQMWFATSLRVARAGLTAGMGMRLWTRDTVSGSRAPFLGLDASLMFYVPGTAAAQYSSAELGLALQIGRRAPLIHTVSYLGEIWVTQANLDAYNASYLAPNSPPGIASLLKTSPKYVELQFSFPDNSSRFAGDNVKFGPQNTISKIGVECDGIDNLIETLCFGTMEECLSPDENPALRRDNIDSLKALHAIKIVAHVQYDPEAIKMGEGVQYNGELNPPDTENKPLVFKVVFEEHDTLVTIPSRNHDLNHFEVAALKAYAMHRKFARDIEAYYERHGVHCILQNEGELMTNIVHLDDTVSVIDPRLVVMPILGKPRIECGNLKQDDMMLMEIDLEFLSFKPGERPLSPPERVQLRDSVPIPDTNTTKPILQWWNFKQNREIKKSEKDSQDARSKPKAPNPASSPRRKPNYHRF
jgi:Type IX secretion system membrane protein PorP/SprF